MATLDDLKAKFAEAMNLFDNLRNRQTTAQKAGLVDEWQSQVGGWKRVADAVKTLTDTGSLKDAIAVLWNGGSSVNGLGIAPLIWLGGSAAIAGSLALTTKWVTDAYSLKARLDAADAAIAKGASPTQAAAAVSTASGDSASTSSAVSAAAGAGKWVAAAVAVSVLAPPLLRAMGGNKAKG